MPDVRCRILDITAMTQYTAEGRRDSLREILEKIQIFWDKIPTAAALDSWEDGNNRVRTTNIYLLLIVT